MNGMDGNRRLNGRHRNTTDRQQRKKEFITKGKRK